MIQVIIKNNRSLETEKVAPGFRIKVIFVKHKKILVGIAVLLIYICVCELDNCIFKEFINLILDCFRG